MQFITFTVAVRSIGLKLFPLSYSQSRGTWPVIKLRVSEHDLSEPYVDYNGMSYVLNKLSI